jgi:DsbC/DsbD-like thiol-disulfide interchange protein
MRKYLSLLIILFGLGLPFQGWANSGGPAAVKVELIQENETIQSGQSFWVSLHLKIEDGWHVYWKNPGDIGMPLKIEWKLPAGFEASPLQWPFPVKFTTSDMVGFGYKGDVMLLSLVTPPDHLQEGSFHQLDAKVEWLVCSPTMCQPGSAVARLTVNTKKEAPKTRADLAAIFSEARSKLPTSKVKISTKRKDGMVQLEVPQSNSELMANPVVGAYFFPEEQEIIDHSADPKNGPVQGVATAVAKTPLKNDPV